MVIVRPVSGHVSPNRYLKPTPLCSVRITRLHRSYGCPRLPTTTALFLAFYTCPRVRTPCAPTIGSPWLSRNLNVRLDTTSDPGVAPATHQYRTRDCCLLGAGTHRPTPTSAFRDSTSSGSASPVTFAPRLLSCLRINQRVTPLTARLDTRPVASGYLGGIRTHSITRPCQVASPHPALGQDFTPSPTPRRTLSEIDERDAKSRRGTSLDNTCTHCI